MLLKILMNIVGQQSLQGLPNILLESVIKFYVFNQQSQPSLPQFSISQSILELIMYAISYDM